MREADRARCVGRDSQSGDGQGAQRTERTHDELVALGGKDRIPFQVDHQLAETLYERDEIIDHFDAQSA